jgi:S-adenosylmethionine-diacylglycerol 3-amino-3-carboxypropyl transferase
MDARARGAVEVSFGPPVIWARDSILFSAENEDTRSELKAFGSIAGQRVLAVTASGGRVLSLLLGRPRSIVAVDLNPAQNALLELKIAAMQELDHDGYLRFFGVRKADDRQRTYARLRPRLSSAVRCFFDREPRKIDAGILFQGRLERFLGIVATVTRVAGPFGLSKLLSAEDLETQRALVAKLETPVWRTLTQAVCRRSVLRLLSGDPGFYRSLPPELPLHEVLYDRIHNHLRHNLLRDNPLLQIVFFGRYVHEPSLPIYLHADTFDAVKDALATVELEIVNATMDEALSDDRRVGFDAFSLSDITSYLEEDAQNRLFDRVFATARPGARLCSRANIYHRPPAPEHARKLDRNPAIERELARHDLSCVHEFVVARMK